MTDLDSTHAHATEQYVEQQQLIDTILAGFAGSPGPVVVDALRAGFRARGLPCPPPTWLSAVAAEVSLGHTYVVAPTVTPRDLEVS